MDKSEYKLRAEEIKDLISRGEYAQAAEIADTIDWRRVKSVMMLCTISDLYKINRRYEDARDMLLLAYERRPGGRTICYSLCELSIKMEEYVQAIEYYKEFVQVAPKDPGRYILQYKLYEAQDVSLEERIAVLEELKKRDYREKWAYELAYLYHRVGLAARCVEECDELILWFGEGKYVIKAMELKMLHQPLTPEQQEKYDHRFDAPGTQQYSQNYAQDPGYGQNETYDPNQGYVQDGSYDPNQGYAQGGSYDPNQGYAQDGSYDPNQGYVQDGGYEPNQGYVQEETYEQVTGDTRVYEPVQPVQPQQAPAQPAEDDFDIHVKTMDVGQYNTINLQAELAAGLREVLSEDHAKETSDSITRSIVAPMIDPGDSDTESLDYPEIADVSEDDLEPETLEQQLCFIGLTGMIDPVRPEVKDAVAQCRAAGIRPVMITGDHKDTAVAIAKELGIITDASQAVTGSALDSLTDEELDNVIENYGVYARVQPEHKVRIVNAWRRKGAITAMTGDGVNDAPSIKSADIGVGMGITGTDVTKNVADMVLSDDNFATIVSAVGEGRQIYDNIRKAIQFLLASNMSEVLGVFFATLLGFTLLNPVHLLFINLITDCFPALALGLERPEPDIMDRPPRSAKDGVFSGGLGFDIAYQGVLITVITLISYLIGHCMEVGYFEMPRGVSPDGMTMAFLTMSMCEIFHSFNMRSQRRSVFTLRGHNRVLWAAMLGSLVLTTVVLEVPPIAAAFGFTPVGWAEYGIALALAVLVIPVVELVKFIQRRRAR